MFTEIVEVSDPKVKRNRKLVNKEFPEGIKIERVTNTGYGMIKIEYGVNTDMYNPWEKIELVLPDPY